MRPRLCLDAKVSRASLLYIFPRGSAAAEVVGTKDSGKEIDAVNGDDADEEVDGATERTEELEEVRGVFVAFVQSWPDSWAIPLTSSAVSGTFRFDILCAHVTGS
eukprot:Em0001g1494a